MRATGALAAALLMAFSACGRDTPTPVRTVASTTIPTTSTTAVPATTTTAAHVVAVRASRHLGTPRPVVTPDVRSHAGSLPPVMLRIRWCESRDNYTAQSRSSSASGAWQFIRSSWANYAGYAEAYLAPPEIQDQKALNVYNAVGTRPWMASKSCWSS